MFVFTILSPCRLVFLLQCTFKLLESSGGTQSASIPLTLGSSVRKFTKQALRVNRNIGVYKQQIADCNQQVIYSMLENYIVYGSFKGGRFYSLWFYF